MHKDMDTLIVTPEDMGRIDRAAALSLSSYGLMERAGQAVAAARQAARPTAAGLQGTAR